MTVTTRRKRRHHMQRMGWTLLIATVAAGAVCTGTGISAAGTPDGTGDVPASSSDGTAKPWTLTNDTDENVWGSIQRHRGSNYTGIGWEKANPAKPGESAGTWIHESVSDSFSDVEFWGRICYHGQWWNMGDPKSYDFTYEDLVLRPAGNGLVLRSDGHGIAYETTVKLIATPGDSGCGAT